MSESKLYRAKQINLEKYTALELAYLLLDILKEIDKRKDIMKKLTSQLDAQTYVHTHEIELNECKSDKDKIRAFDKLKNHLTNRRLSKQDMLVMTECLSVVKQKQMMSELVPKIKHKQKYFKVEDGEQIVDSREYSRFYKKYVKNFSHSNQSN